jgi:hypothetical protein
VRKVFDDFMFVSANFSGHKDLDSSGNITQAHDRWLAEAYYRNSARMGKVIWMKARRDYQDLFAEIIEFDVNRRNRMREILLSFLPRRRRLFETAGDALVPVSLMKVPFTRQEQIGKEEDQAIEETLQRLSRSKLKDVNQHRSTVINRSLAVQKELWDDSALDHFNPQYCPAALGNDLSESAYVEERKIFEVRIGAEWKLALGVLTRDHYLHIFVTDFKTDDAMSLDYERMTAGALSQVLKSPNPDVSIRLNFCEVKSCFSESKLDFETDDRVIQIVPKIKDSARFKFRKRDRKEITIRFASTDEAVVLVNAITCITANTENELIICSKHGSA